MIKRNKTKTFLLSFLISLIALILMGTASIVVLNLKDKKETDNQSATNEYQPNRDEDMNVVYMLCPSRASIVDIYLLVRISPLDKSIVVTSIPKDTQATVNTKTGSISKLYDYGGAYMATQAIENAFDIKVARYIRVDNNSVCKTIDMLGDIQYDLKEQVSYDDSINNIVTEIQSGKQSLDGRRVLAILRDQNQSDVVKRTNAQIDIIGEALTQKFNSTLGKNLDNIYKNLINMVDTNITTFDYEYRKNGVISLANFSGSKVKTIKISGEQKDKIFEFDESSKEEIKQNFNPEQKNSRASK